MFAVFRPETWPGIRNEETVAQCTPIMSKWCHNLEADVTPRRFLEVHCVYCHGSLHELMQMYYQLPRRPCSSYPRLHLCLFLNLISGQIFQYLYVFRNDIPRLQNLWATWELWPLCVGSADGFCLQQASVSWFCSHILQLSVDAPPEPMMILTWGYDEFEFGRVHKSPGRTHIGIVHCVLKLSHEWIINKLLGGSNEW